MTHTSEKWIIPTATTGVFSSVNATHELRVREIVEEELGAAIPVSLLMPPSSMQPFPSPPFPWTDPIL